MSDPTSEFEWSPVTLPSKGALYDGKIPGGQLSIRPYGEAEEELLLVQGGQPLDKLKAIIRACVRLPQGFDADELLVGDRLYLLIAIRTQTHGGEYRITWPCQFCQAAHHDMPVDILQHLHEEWGGLYPPGVNAGDIGAERVLSEPIEVKLPVNGSVVRLNFLRGRDEAIIFAHTKQMKMRSVDKADPSYRLRLALMLVEKDGAPFESLLKKQDFIRGLKHARDTAAIRRIVDEAEPGIDTTLSLDCPACGRTCKVDLPLTPEFFFPS